MGPCHCLLLRSQHDMAVEFSKSSRNEISRQKVITNLTHPNKNFQNANFTNICKGSIQEKNIIRGSRQWSDRIPAFQSSSDQHRPASRISFFQHPAMLWVGRLQRGLHLAIPYSIIWSPYEDVLTRQRHCITRHQTRRATPYRCQRLVSVP